MKTYYIGAFVKEEAGNYSVYFPDIPNAVTGGDSVEECMEYGEDILEVVLQDMASEKKPIPVPSSLEEVKKMVKKIREEDGLSIPEEVIYQLFSAPSLDMVPVKVTISLPKAVLEEADKKAKACGFTRSGFLAHAAQVYQPHCC